MSVVMLIDVLRDFGAGNYLVQLETLERGAVRRPSPSHGYSPEAAPRRSAWRPSRSATSMVSRASAMSSSWGPPG